MDFHRIRAFWMESSPFKWQTKWFFFDKKGGLVRVACLFFLPLIKKIVMLHVLNINGAIFVVVVSCIMNSLSLLLWFYSLFLSLHTLKLPSDERNDCHMALAQMNFFVSISANYLFLSCDVVFNIGQASRGQHYISHHYPASHQPCWAALRPTAVTWKMIRPLLAVDSNCVNSPTSNLFREMILEKNFFLTG